MNTMRTLLFSALTVSLTLAFAGPSHAQDDPFDLPSGLFGDPDGEPTVENPSAGEPGSPDDEAEPLPPSPLVTQLLEHAARGKRQLGDAIASLAKIGRWREVDQLLASAAGRGLSEPEKARMARQIGPALLLRISLHPQIGDQARAAVREFSVAAKTQAESPDRLRQAIEQLDASSVDRRLAAARTLLAGGDAAIAELVASLVSENPAAPRDELLRTLMSLGDGGGRALRRLALYGKDDVRSRALQSLARMNAPGVVFDLVTAMHGGDSTPQEVQVATEILERRRAGLPSRKATIRVLREELERLRQLARETPNDQQVAVAWSVDAQQSGVTHQPTPVVMLAYRDATDAAARLRRLGNLAPQDAQAVLAADLAYRVMVDPDWGDPDQKQAVRSANPGASSARALASAISDSLDSDDHPALVGLIRLVDETAATIECLEYVRGAGPEPTPLVKAATASDPRVRYEAAIKVTQLADASAYAGSSRVRATLAEMASLGPLPTAILVETRSDVIVRQEANLQQLGYGVDVVGSVGQLQRRLARGGDLRMIVAKTDLADQSAIELIDVVRRAERGGEIPIALYGPEVTGAESTRWSTPVVQMDQPYSPLAYSGLIQQIEAMRRLPPLSAVDRQLYAEAAERWLADFKLAY